MRNLLQQHFEWQWLICFTLALCFSSCKDDSESGSYDPNKPVTLTDYYPTTGPISTQVILNGSNFGTNKNNVKVFFNEKEAAVVSVTGNKMLVLTPKLPGEDCIIKVQVGNQVGQYEQTFDYIIQTNVSTLVGGDKSATQNVTGTVSLAEAQFKNAIKEVIAVDASKNVYFAVQDVDDGMNSKGYIYVLNEEANQLKVIKNNFGYFLTAPILAYNMLDNNVYIFHSNSGNYDYYYFETNNGFSEVSMGNVSYDDSNIHPGGSGSMASWGARKCFAMNPSDGKFYIRSGGGYFYRINPLSRYGENLTNGRQVGTGDGNTYGCAFDPNDSNILYFSNDSRHCIYKYDLTTGECEVFAGSGTAGYLDGYAVEAQFNQPCQIAFDSQGDMYIADKQNHCIRKIAMKTGYVSTVAGLPQQAGYRNGTDEVAQFNQPIGLAIDSDDVLYVGDSENRAIRRIAVE
jgi:IPT/TIG domain./NHL repeat.